MRRRPRVAGGARQSRFVRAMRVAMPLAVLGMIALLLIWPSLNRQRLLPAATGDLALEMVNARYEGRDEAGRPFVLGASGVRHVPGQTGAAQLENPQAALRLEDGQLLRLSARQGLYDEKSEILALGEGVVLTHDAGWQAQSQALTIDIGAGRASTDQPVTGGRPKISVAASGLVIEDRGDLVRLTGPARITLEPGWKEGM